MSATMNATLLAVISEKAAGKIQTSGEWKPHCSQTGNCVQLVKTLILAWDCMWETPKGPTSFLP